MCDTSSGGRSESGMIRSPKSHLVKIALHRSLDVPLAEVDGVLHQLHLRGVPVTSTAATETAQGKRWCYGLTNQPKQAHNFQAKRAKPRDALPYTWRARTRQNDLTQLPARGWNLIPPNKNKKR